MTGRCRVGMAGLLFMLLAWVPAKAQTGDTVRVGQGVDTTVVADSTQAVDSVQETLDTSAISSKDAVPDHPEPVVLRTMADSVVTGLKNDRIYAYANDPEYWRWKDSPDQLRTAAKPDKASDRFLLSQGFEYFVLFLLGGILLYAIIKIIVSNRLQLFYKAPKRPIVVKSGDESLPEDDLEGQLTHFMQTKDYRQAVRHLYLKTLRLLNDRGLIRYHQESTNYEYWQQLKATPQGAPFRDLTTIYEKVWYGEFPLGDTLFGRLHQYFEEFYKSVRV